jgi:nucleoside-triphosphatase THEP1
MIERVVGRIERPMTGFFTREIREKGRRTGFSITTLDGHQGMLAHETIRSKFRVGKYGVNLPDVDHIAVPAMLPTKREELVVVDEVGKMECFSSLFRETLIKVLDSDYQVLGSIAQKGDRFIQRVKARDDVFLVPLSKENRDAPDIFSRLLSAVHEVPSV